MTLPTTGFAKWLLSRRSIPAAVLVFGLAITALLYVWAVRSESLKRASEVSRLASALRVDLTNRVQAYIDTLPGLRAFYQLGKTPNDRQFTEYVNTISLQSRFPGLALTFIGAYVPHPQLPRFTESVRRDRSLLKEGHPSFRVTPPGERPEHMVIRHLFPMAERTFGYDLYDPAASYRAAVDAAVAKGSPVATAPVRLAKDRKRPLAPESNSVVIRLAVYRRGGATRTEADRKQSVIGVVGVAFLTTELIHSVLPAETAKNLHLRIVDSQARHDGEAGVVYDSDWAFVSSETRPSQVNAPRLSANVADRQWELTLTDRSAETEYWVRPVPLLVALMGVSISLLLSLINFILVRASEISARAVTQATSDLRKKQHTLEEAQRIAHVGNWDWDIASGEMHWSEEVCRIFGRDVDDAIGSYELFLAGVHRDDRARVQMAVDDALAGKADYDVEYRIVRQDRTEVALHTRGEVIRNEAGQAVRMTGTVLDVTARKKAEEDINRLAYFDALTGLPNRRLLMDRMGHALRSAQRSRDMGAVAFIDLDNFKNVNDARGHAAGDRLLQQVAQRLSSLVRESDTVARLGGDEFVVIMEGLGPDRDSAADSAMLLVRTLCAALEKAFDIDGQLCHSGASIGVALFPQTGQASVDDLLREADTAMYGAKEAGRNQIAFFESSMGLNVNQRIALENDLKEAIANHQFEMHLQPQVDPAGQPVGCELLMRWTHPVRGSVSPASFIPVAEKSGLILKMGDWVLRQGCLTQVRLAQSGRPLPVSINVSPRQFRQPDFVPRVAAVLRETGADASLLILEVTEGLLIDNLDETVARMRELAAMGVRFSIDDFGTGYSSLSYLKKLPIYELKIDKSFVQDTPQDNNDTAIVQSILSMARHLGLRVVAEGVETQAQVDFLVACGCDAMQGYFFAPPMSLDDWFRVADSAV